MTLELGLKGEKFRSEEGKRQARCKETEGHEAACIILDADGWDLGSRGRAGEEKWRGAQMPGDKSVDFIHDLLCCLRSSVNSFLALGLYHHVNPYSFFH